MPAKKISEKSKDMEKTVKTKTEAKTATKEASLSIAVYGMDGVKKGTVALNKEIFGAKLNEKLILQALRVYMVNQRQGTAEAKTRGEVVGSTRKIYRQKGTGRARHGAIMAPIFVGGGVAHGPRVRAFELKLSKQMKKKALFSALSSKLAAEKIFVIDGESATGKTSEIHKLLKKINVLGKKDKVLFVSTAAAARGARNIQGVVVEAPHAINTYEIVNSTYLVTDKSAIETMNKTFLAAKSEPKGEDK